MKHRREHGSESSWADEAWCALALLHQEKDRRESFSERKFLDRVKAGTRTRTQPEYRPNNLTTLQILSPNPRYRMFTNHG